MRQKKVKSRFEWLEYIAYSNGIASIFLGIMPYFLQKLPNTNVPYKEVLPYLILCLFICVVSCFSLSYLYELERKLQRVGYKP